MNQEYIKELTQDEKIVFIKLLCKLLGADGVADPDELKYINMLLGYFDIAQDTVKQIAGTAASLDHISEAKKITNRQHALELVKELCFLANANGNLEDAELNIIADVAQALNIDDQKLIVINRFVLDSLILEKAGQVILEKNNG